MVRFSIIVPAYNVEKYLGRCLDSICNQSFTDIELIIIDDGSTDGSREIYESYARKDDRITVIQMDNLGPSAARNAGMDRASGEYIMFVDSDDYIDVDTCERFNAIIENGAPDMIIGGATVHEEDRTYPMVHTNLRENVEYTGIEYTRLAISAREWYATVWMGCYRRDYLDRNNLRFKLGIFHEDLEFLPRLFLNAQTVRFIDRPFYHYCIRPGSITTASSEADIKKKSSDIRLVLEEWAKIFSEERYGSIRKLLNGMLAKQFLYFSRLYKNTDIKKVPGVDFKFLWENALDHKEKGKALLFFCFPHLYVNL